MTKTTGALAREAGIDMQAYEWSAGSPMREKIVAPVSMEDLARFEALVRADECMRLAKKCSLFEKRDTPAATLACLAAAIRSGGG